MGRRVDRRVVWVWLGQGLFSPLCGGSMGAEV